MGSGGLARVKATPAQVDLLKVPIFTSFRSFLEMGNSRSQLQLQEEEINEITAETGFTKQQIERLYARFTSLDKQNHGYLTREDFSGFQDLPSTLSGTGSSMPSSMRARARGRRR